MSDVEDMDSDREEYLPASQMIESETGNKAEAETGNEAEVSQAASRHRPSSHSSSSQINKRKKTKRVSKTS